MSLLWRKKSDAPVAKGLLTDYLAQPGVAPDTSVKPDPTFGVTVAPVSVLGISSAEAFGQAVMTLEIHGTGLVSSEQIGAPRAVPQVMVRGIASQEAFGTPRLADGIVAQGIASGEAFGLPIIFPVPVAEVDDGGHRKSSGIDWAARKRFQDDEAEALLLAALM